jgi:hypothetical protein
MLYASTARLEICKCNVKTFPTIHLPSQTDSWRERHLSSEQRDSIYALSGQHKLTSLYLNYTCLLSMLTFPDRMYHSVLGVRLW